MKYIAFAGALILGASSKHALAQSTDVSGVFRTIWADPVSRGERPFAVHSVTADNGTTTYVTVPDDVARSVGGLSQLNGRRIRLGVSTRRVSGGLMPLGSSPSAPVLAETVRDIQPVAPGNAPLATDAVARPFVTLLCRFPDFPDVMPGTKADAQRAMGAAYPGGAHYWSEVSHGRIDLAGSEVHGWYTLPKPRAYYVPDQSVNTTTLASDCAAAADADVHFPTFAGVNIVANTDIGCCAYGGGGGLTIDGVSKSYAMTWLHGSSLQTTGVMMHEMGHGFGLQHSSGPYGLVYDSKWDVMSTAAWHFAAGTNLQIGAHVNAYGKRQLGWIPDARVFTVTPGTHTILLENLAQPGQNANYLVARIPAPAFASHEYFLLEARGMSGYDAPLPGAGVVIHRIGGGGATPSNVVDPDGNYDPSDAGAVIEAGEWYQDRANGIHVAVEQRVGNAFRVTIRLGDYPRVTIDRPTRDTTLVAAAGDVARDSARITIAGTGSSSTPWTAAVIAGSGLVLENTRGTGDGMLRWRFDPRVVGAGQYGHTIRVRTADGIFADLIVRVSVQQANALTAGLSASVLTDSIITGRQGSAFVGVRTGGTGATTATWTATADVPWITVVTASGTGRSELTFRRDARNLAPGIHVGRVTVTVAGAVNGPVTLVDSLRVLEVPVMRVTARGGTSATLRQGAAPTADSMYVELSGPWAGTGMWYGGQFMGQGLGLGTQPKVPGNGWFRFTRAPRDLPPGVYPGKWRLTLSVASDINVEVDDTLRVVAAPTAISLSKHGHRDSVVSTYIGVRDSVWVQTEGPNSSNTKWSALPGSPRLFLVSAGGGGIPGEGMGPGWLHWVRNLTATPAGRTIDTIEVRVTSGAGLPARLIDTVFMFGAPSMSLAAPSRTVQLPAGSPVIVRDSARVTLEGWEAASIRWTAEARAAWLTFGTSSGSGTGWVRWTRGASGLVPGVYIDTITVSAAALGSPLRIVDTLRVYPALVVSSEPSRRAAMMGAAYADTLAWTGGPEGSARWTLVGSTLPPGLTLDPESGRIAGIPERAGTYSFTARVTIDTVAAERTFTADVAKPSLATAAVLDDLLGVTPLGADHRRYLDLLGNRNGRVDIGDVRAWIRDVTGSPASASDIARMLHDRGGKP